MTTQVFRVTRVHASTSPVARIDAVDADGHDLRLEVPRDLVRSAAPGRLLVLQWSMHDVPGVVAEPTSTQAPDVAPMTAQVRTDPAAVDQEFMEMMARGRPTTVASSPAAQGRSIDRELSTLLGAPGGKGQK
ncbi:MAG: hypothetical protein JNL82_36375 [Myxococcales bacterium]|nr:hypothetical protein [Myxococcales bacterium]